MSGGPKNNPLYPPCQGDKSRTPLSYGSSISPFLRIFDPTSLRSGPRCQGDEKDNPLYPPCQGDKCKNPFSYGASTLQVFDVRGKKP